MVSLSIAEWHRQFLRQAGWTRGIRSRLYRQAGLWRAEAILDVGCGTGAITEEIARATRGRVVGVDIDPAMLGYAANWVEGVEWAAGDAHCLPFAAGSFDAVVCNFLLLWTEDPGRAVREMARVVKEAGVVLATTEPDYGGRIDFPEDIALGPLMEESLKREGAHPRIGRRLKSLFSAAALDVQVGVIASIWDDRQLEEEFEAEWDFVFETLANVADVGLLDKYEGEAWRALKAGKRVVFMPMFWAVGRKSADVSRD